MRSGVTLRALRVGRTASFLVGVERRTGDLDSLGVVGGFDTTRIGTGAREGVLTIRAGSFLALGCMSNEGMVRDYRFPHVGHERFGNLNGAVFLLIVFNYGDQNTRDRNCC